MLDAVIAVDIGGTNSIFAVVNTAGEIISQKSMKTGSVSSFDEYVAEATKLINSLISENSQFTVKGLGIGAPDANYYTGTIDHAVNLNWGEIVPLQKALSNSTGLQVAITNDANAAALGEMLFGGAKGLTDFIEITLGTGFGSGVVIDGKMLYGHSGFGGEIGHMELIQNGRECGCGRLGCTETYVSATGICRTVQALIAEKMDSSPLREISSTKLSSKMVYDAAKSGDLLALEAFEITGDYLGRVLADSVAFSSPEAIFLFGGLANAGDLLLTPVKKYFSKYCMRMFGSIKIEISHLDESTAAVLGSAAHIWNELGITVKK
jgi:glucokinase